MVISRLSGIVRSLSRGRCITGLCRTVSAPRSYGHYMQHQKLEPHYGKLAEASIFQKYRSFCTGSPSEEKQMISVTFVDKDGEEQVIKVPVGMSMLEAAHENDIELEGKGSVTFFFELSSFVILGTKFNPPPLNASIAGACEGSLACSTCHLIVMDVDYYNKLEDPTDEENDMLDLAFGLTETSRLGCQVIAKPELDGVRLAVPAATRNFAVDGFVPKPH
ncbi:Adrenodoxin-like protein 1, mitochondrial [Linum perenne]